MNPLDLPTPEGDPPEPYIDPLEAERALADDAAELLMTNHRIAKERWLARYRKARGL